MKTCDDKTRNAGRLTTQLIRKYKKNYIIKPNKLGARTSGPYDIEQVHSNGTIIISLREGVTERKKHTTSNSVPGEYGIK